MDGYWNNVKGLVRGGISGFFFIALAKSIAPWLSNGEDLEVYHALPASAVLSAVFFAVNWRALWTEQAKKVF